ncbi:MAG: SRPBCC domain-containing protein [Shinella sp.]|nr:SRPBCC domain-containing protein [Shinella sp.]
MSDTTSDRPAKDLVLEYDLDAPPEKVWRAIGIAEFRKRWLPDSDLVDTAPVSTVPGEEVRYRLQDDESPHLESLVTFHLSPNERGGTTLRIVHDLTDARLTQPQATNDNGLTLMRAA